MGRKNMGGEAPWGGGSRLASELCRLYLTIRWLSVLSAGNDGGMIMPQMIINGNIYIKKEIFLFFGFEDFFY